MASLKQIDANRRNAQKSTGPTSPDGKARSSQNAVKHGLTSKEFFLKEGEEPEFSDFLAAFHDDLQPEGALEDDLFRQFTHAAWGLRRCRRLEVESAEGYEGDPLTFSDMDQLDRHIRRLERTYHRTLKELRALQTERTVRRLAANPNLQNEPNWPAESPLIPFPIVFRQLKTLPNPVGGGLQPAPDFSPAPNPDPPEAA